MATTRTFSAMINEYLPNELFNEELLKRDWFYQNVAKDQKWLGGDVIVPFVGAYASTVEFGSLASDSDISEMTAVRGKISGYKELIGSLVFNATDLMQHGKVSEQNLLRILPDQVNAFMDYMKQVASQGLLTGPAFATLTEDGDTGGTGLMTVDKIDRFQIGQKFYLDDGNSSPQALYVTAVNVNTNVVTVSDSRGGSAYSISGYTEAQSAKCYHPGSQSAGFTSVTEILLPYGTGIGSQTVHGQTKTAYPILQSVAASGASITASNILEKIFDHYSLVRQKAKGNADKIVVSYKHLGSIMKLIEARNGMYSQPTPPRVSVYGWTEIDVVSVRGKLTIVGLQEANDSEILFLDMNAFTFRSNGGFRKFAQPDGQEYYVKRAVTGYSFILDIALFGDLECRAPGHCGILHTISY